MEPYTEKVDVWSAGVGAPRNIKDPCIFVTHMCNPEIFEGKAELKLC